MSTALRLSGICEILQWRLASPGSLARGELRVPSKQRLSSFRVPMTGNMGTLHQIYDRTTLLNKTRRLGDYVERLTSATLLQNGSFFHNVHNTDPLPSLTASEDLSLGRTVEIFPRQPATR